MGDLNSILFNSHFVSVCFSVNNAGIGQAGVMEKVTLDQIKTVYETNVFGLIRLTQAVVPGMKAKKSGHIINVSSVGGLMGKFE